MSWADIPSDILRCIAGKTLIQDLVRAAAVCRSWQASLRDQQPKFPICLMLAENEDNNLRGFCTASNDKVMELDLPEIRDRRCWGTPFGWLVSYGLIDLEIWLFNPLSRACLSLPSQRTFCHSIGAPSAIFRRFFIKKFVLSSSPTSLDCVAMAIYSLKNTNMLAFAKPGYQQWIPIDIISCQLHDVAYSNGSFYALNQQGQLLICQDLDGPYPKAVEFIQSPVGDSAHRKYIVDLGGCLCMVVRIAASYDAHVLDFDLKELHLRDEIEIFKLDMGTKNWEKILSLGDWSLFLGNCCNFSVMAADHHLGCTANCIYFTDDNLSFCNAEADGFDTGVYSCDNKEFLRLPVSVVNEQGLFRPCLSPPLWIIPNFH